jgi:hypothetical protein
VSADQEARVSGGITEDPIPTSAARIAAGWQRRFVVDQTRVVEMVRLYQALGYETAVDPVRPEDLADDPAGDPEARAPRAADAGCHDCRLVTLRWLHVIYTRPARSLRAN